MFVYYYEMVPENFDSRSNSGTQLEILAIITSWEKMITACENYWGLSLNRKFLRQNDYILADLFVLRFEEDFLRAPYISVLFIDK